MEAPRQEYERRRELRRAAVRLQERLDLRIGILRLLVFAAAVIFAWLSLKSDLVSPWWLLLPAIAFLTLLVRHDRVRKARRRLERAASHYDRGIARIENRWVGTGESGDRFLDKSHAYAEDLDLFGRGSLFELICTARTRGGEEALAAWLKSPAAPEDLVKRQAAVDELRRCLDLREDLAVLGDDIHAGVHAEDLASWGKAPSLLHGRLIPAAAAVLSLATTAALVSWLWSDRGLQTFLLVAVAQGVFHFFLRRKVLQVLADVERPGQDLELLSGILGRLEKERLSAPRLVELRRALDVAGLPPSRQIASLNLMIMMQKQLFAPLAALFLWDIQTAYAIESWRRKSGVAVASWLACVAEMEALCALACYAYEHPADPFPELETGGPRFEGTGLGHPFLSEESCVRSDIRLGADLCVLVVSGSNMSGKSTLLRTIGVNTVLALAGAPVRARSLRLSPLAVGASIQRRDSLQAGTSRFYAEIMRLRQLVDITAGSRPLLFLLDELLHGTNSHDRSIGAEALVRDLAHRGAIGLLTTHDLALAGIADLLAPRAANVHFEDFIENGKLTFDYRLRPGVVRKSNALELMRSVGLQI